MQGRIVDAYTGEPVPGASLLTMRNGVPVGTAADADGRWSFGFNPGESVRVSSIGYTTRWTTAGSLALAFALTPLVEELPGVTITAPRTGAPESRNLR